MNQGLYRTTDPFLGECVHTHWSMNIDAYPIVSRSVYEEMKWEPHFSALLNKHEYEILIGRECSHSDLPRYRR